MGQKRGGGGLPRANTQRRETRDSGLLHPLHQLCTGSPGSRSQVDLLYVIYGEESSFSSWPTCSQDSFILISLDWEFSILNKTY